MGKCVGLRLFLDVALGFGGGVVKSSGGATTASKDGQGKHQDKK